MTMNSYEIDEAKDFWKDHPVMGPATTMLANLRDMADQNSDGWAYWPKPSRASRRLQEFIQAARQGGSTTEADWRATFAPIKQFLTRHSGLLPNGPRVSFYPTQLTCPECHCKLEDAGYTVRGVKYCNRCGEGQSSHSLRQQNVRSGDRHAANGHVNRNRHKTY